MNSSKNASFWQLFKELNILPVQSQYICSLLLFVTKNKVQFLFNLQVHKINARQTSHLYIKLGNVRRGFLPRITRELRPIAIYQQPLKMYLVISINSN
jgi:hypothetical protein